VAKMHAQMYGKHMAQSTVCKFGMIRFNTHTVPAKKCMLISHNGQFANKPIRMQVN